MCNAGSDFAWQKLGQLPISH